MRCINCQNEINVGAIVCPYCHTAPYIFGSQPYDGIKNIHEPCPHDPEMTLGILGTIFLPVLPPVGVTLWGLAGLSLVSKWWKNRKQE